MQDLAVIRDLLLQGLKKEKDVAAFYSTQAQNYDGFREALLPLRDVFMELAVPWTQGIKTWISVGCGTARDIEFVIERVRHWQTKVYLLDLSPELLKMAEKRVRLYNLESLVTCIVGDFLSKEVRAKLPKQVDLVTCSYCLTMMPSWETALKGMRDLLAPQGYLGLVDFTMGRDETYHQKFCRWWFKNDGVYLNREHTKWLQANTKKMFFHEEARRCPYNIIFPTSYIFIGQKDK
jgi:ubiquinone/menaquinone biosynthesis C-methylase UbiE